MQAAADAAVGRLYILLFPAPPYVYEERPLDRRGNVLVGRGLEGLSEAVLKLFGI